MKNKLSLFIPVHSLNENEKPLFDGLLESIKNQNRQDFILDILCVPSLEKQINGIVNDKEFSLLVNVHVKKTNGSNFQQMVNCYVEEHVTTEWFSIIQYDDALLRRFVDYTLEYINRDIGEANVYFNLIRNLDENNNFLGFSNEAAWAKSVMDTEGVLDRKGVEMYEFSQFSIAGATFNTIAFVKHGMFKENLKMFFDMEMILRMIDNGAVVYVLPRVLYTHLNNRQGSMADGFFKEGKNVISKWLDLAKKASRETGKLEVNLSDIYGKKEDNE